MMNSIISKLRDSQYIEQQAFRMHCESIVNGIPVSYDFNDSLKTVSNFDELDRDFPNLPSSLKMQIIDEVKESKNL